MDTEKPERLIWARDIINKEFHAPFSVQRDCDYCDSLEKLYKDFYERCADVGADRESLEVIERYTDRVLDALGLFYKGMIGDAHRAVRALAEECKDDDLAFASVDGGVVFPGTTKELQFFHARIGEPRGFKAQDMLHLPYSMRGFSGSYRFSIPGLPSYYLANSSYGCWIELGQPAERDFNVSPVLLEEGRRVFNLAVMCGDPSLFDFNPERTRTWLKLIVLMFATSYTVEEPGRTFKSEFLISQSVMLACRDLGLDGVAYYSKRVTDEMFARAAINLALFADYVPGEEYGEICRHLKVGDSFNYMMFRQLGRMAEHDEYELRSLETPYITNIGSCYRQRSYRCTDFCAFDRYLFGEWGIKQQLEFGNALRDGW